MVQRRCGLRFSLEACQGLPIHRHIVGEKLQRNKAAQARIFGFVHDTHPAAAKFLDDAVVGDGLADEGVGVRHGAAILGCDLRQVNETVWFARQKSTPNWGRSGETR